MAVIEPSIDTRNYQWSCSDYLYNKLTCQPYLTGQALVVFINGQLKALYNQIVAGAATDHDKALAVMAWVQHAVRHPAYPQKWVSEPTSSIYHPLVRYYCALGQCGPTNRAFVDLCVAGGMPARIVQLNQHVSAEVLCAGAWRFFCCDALDGGQYVAGPGQTVASVPQILADPTVLDSCQWFRKWDLTPVEFSPRDMFMPSQVTIGGVSYITPVVVTKPATADLTHRQYGWHQQVWSDPYAAAKAGAWYHSL